MSILFLGENPNSLFETIIHDMVFQLIALSICHIAILDNLFSLSRKRAIRCQSVSFNASEGCYCICYSIPEEDVSNQKCCYPTGLFRSSRAVTRVLASVTKFRHGTPFA